MKGLTKKLLALVICAAAVFTACGNPWMKRITAPLYKDKDGGSDGPPPVFTLNSIMEIVDYLAAASGGTSASTPIVLPPLDIDLAADWTNLLQAIADANGGAGAYVKLDLSACRMSGTYFNPGAANNGEQYVTALTLPDAATSIAGGTDTAPTFRYFSNLREISGEQVTTVGSFAFYNCASLTSVTFPAVTTIRSAAFTYCTGLTSITLPASLSSVESIAFAGCTGLTNISVDADNPNFSASSGMLMNKAGMTLIAWPSASGLVILNGITTVGESAFATCTGLTSVTLPEAITIDYLAFQLCTSLTSVTLSTATDIVGSAFRGCTSLTSVTLPEATNIGSFAFSFTGGQALIVTLGAAPPTLGTNIFDSVTSPKAVTVEVPTGAAVNYDSAWQNSFTGGNTNISLTITEI
jgi:hypothetical protein